MTGMQLFQVLKPRIGQREAEAIIEYVDTTIKENNKEMHETNLRILATKEDIFLLREDLANVKGGLMENIASVEGRLEAKIANVEGNLETKITSVEGRLETKIANVEGRLETKIAEVKSDVVRWTFALFVTLMLAILGLYLKK